MDLLKEVHNSVVEQERVDEVLRAPSADTLGNEKTRHARAGEMDWRQRIGSVNAQMPPQPDRTEKFVAKPASGPIAGDIVTLPMGGTGTVVKIMANVVTIDTPEGMKEVSPNLLIGPVKGPGGKRFWGLKKQ